jgi:hypothetical protein
MTVTQPRLNINFKILPFGQAAIEMKSGEQIKEEKIEQLPVYTVPKTTDVKMIEITFGGENYIVPKTTGGLL